MNLVTSMKWGVSTLLVVGLVGTVGCDKKPKLDNDKNKGSYSIGIQIGRMLKSQNADVDLKALAAGIEDTLADKEPQLKQEEMQAALQAMQEVAMKKATEDAAKNEKEGEDYLVKNKSNPNVKTTESGLQYEVLKEGDGPSPKATDVVKVHYTGTLISGKKFDSSVDRGQPIEFPVNGVIPGWTEALQLMKTGAKYKLFIPSKLAYGPRGNGEIPPNSVLIFEVELLEVKPQPAAAPEEAPAAAPKKANKK